MCGQPDHIHEVGAKYNRKTRVLTYMRWCVKCCWSRVVHEEEYKPEPTFDGSVYHMDNQALMSHVQAQRNRLYLVNSSRFNPKLARLQEEAVRRAS